MTKGVEICNSSGTAWLFTEICSNGCTNGVCTGGCTPGERRCAGNTLEECAGDGQTTTVVEVCGNFCDGRTRSCALDATEITSNTTLNGNITYAGALIIRAGVSVTSSSGNLSIYADSIVIETGASIQIASTGNTPAGRGFDSGAFGNGGGGSYGTQGTKGTPTIGGAPGPIHGLTNDFEVTPGSQGGLGWSQTDGSKPLGGLGGGVLRLVAKNVDIAGQIRAPGAPGAQRSTFIGGSGSGGGVLVIGSDAVKISGAIAVPGGPGESGVSSVGGKGRIKIFYGVTQNVTGTLDGAVSQHRLVPQTVTSPTNPSESLWYNDDFQEARFTWDRPFAGVQGYYHRVDQTIGTLPVPANASFVATEQVSVPRASFSQGVNYFHLTTVDTTAVLGTAQAHFAVQLNTQPATIASSSHPNETAWSANAAVFFSWTLPQAAKNFAGAHYVLDHFADTRPTKSDTFLAMPQTSVLFSNVQSGIWFLHLVTEDTQGVLTRAVDHYQVRVGSDPGTGVLLGQVLTESLQPVNGATVAVNRGIQTATTNAAGSYNLQGAIAGQWEVRVTKDGFATAYANATVVSGQSTTVDFRLTPTP